MDRDEQREYQKRLRDLRDHEGVTCTLELAFDYDSRLYVYEMQPDWYNEFLNIEDEILSHFGLEMTKTLTTTTARSAATSPRTKRWLHAGAAGPGCAAGGERCNRRWASARPPRACWWRRGFAERRSRAAVSSRHRSPICTIRC